MLGVTQIIIYLVYMNHGKNSAVPVDLELPVKDTENGDQVWWSSSNAIAMHQKFFFFS